jgi:hypothetical protein
MTPIDTGRASALCHRRPCDTVSRPRLAPPRRQWRDRPGPGAIRARRGTGLDQIRSAAAQHIGHDETQLDPPQTGMQQRIALASTPSGTYTG